MHRHPGGRDRGADRDAAEGEHEEVADRLAGAERADQGRGDGEAEQDQAGGVVEQAFALQQRLQAAGQAHPLQHGAGRDRVGRRDDRAEREAGGKGEGRDQPLRHRRDDKSGEHHRPDRQRQDAGQVAAEAAEGGVIGPVEQQGRQEQDKDQLGIERDGGKTRHEGQRPAADQQRGRRRQVHPRRQQMQCHRGAQQEEDGLERLDRMQVALSPLADAELAQQVALPVSVTQRGSDRRGGHQHAAVDLRVVAIGVALA